MPRFFPEADLIKFLNQIDEDAQYGRGNLKERMEENIKIIKGKQWKGSTDPYFLYNVIQDAVEDKMGKLSESKPQIRIMPTGEGMGDVAKVLHKTVSSLWDTNRAEYKTERIGYFGALSGVSAVSTPFNPKLNNGTGDVMFIVRDPRYCGFDRHSPDAAETQQGEYVVMEDYVPVDLLRSLYPGRGALIEPEAKMMGLEAPRLITPIELVKGAYDRLTGKKKEEPKSPIPRAYFKAYYIQDRRTSIEDLGTVPITKLTKWADGGIPFPGGRRIIRGGDVILEDSWNPYWDGQYPIDLLSWKVDLESIFGPDEIQGVKRMQEAVNRIGDAYTRNTILNSVIRYIMDDGALSPDERNKLSNEAAQIIIKNPGRSLEATVPPTLPSDVLNFVQLIMDWIRQKIGVTQPPTQKRVPSIVTGPAIEGLQLMVETPIRTAARRLEDFYERIGQKLISRVFQYYLSNRVLHLIGDNGKWAEFEFLRRNLIVDSRGRPRSEEDIRKVIQEQQFRFRIDPGSSLAITRVQRAMMKYQLASQGWLHPREVLEELGFENPDEKLKQAKEAIESGLINLDKKDRRTGPTTGGELPTNAEGLAA